MAGTVENRLSTSPNGEVHSPDHWASIKERNPWFVNPASLPEDDPKRNILFVMGHGHLDGVWKWNMDEGDARADHTIRSALSIMDKKDYFTFTMSSPRHYQVIEDADPVLFQEIVGRVHEGRWGVLGGGMVEPDMNLLPGEMMANQIRLSQQYYREHLGITPTVALQADAFGHLPFPFPYDFYMHLRPQVNEMNLPLGMYRWQLPENSYGIDAERIFEEYCSGPNSTKDQIHSAAKAMKGRVRYLSKFYGVGNHGGGPTLDLLSSIIEPLHEDKSLPQIVHSTPEEYYATVRPLLGELPRVSEELQWHARGCYSVDLANNLAHAETEALMGSSRALSTMRSWFTGLSYPHDVFREDDEIKAEHEFHDDRVGTSIDEVMNHTKDALGGINKHARKERSKSVRAIAKELTIPPEDDSTPWIVMNDVAFNRSGAVEIEDEDIVGNVQVVDSKGTELPFQATTPAATSSTGGFRRRKLLVMKEKNPSQGWDVIRVRYNREQQTQFENIIGSETSLDNGLTRIEFDEQTGELIHFFDKTLEYDFVYKDTNDIVHQFAYPAICPDDHNGRPLDTWAHGKNQWRPYVKEESTYDMKLGGYTRPEFEGFTLHEPLSTVEEGPVRRVLYGKWRYHSQNRSGGNDSELEQWYALYAGDPTLYIDAKLTWHEEHEMLKYLFSVGLESRQVHAQGPYTSLTRGEDGSEWPMHRFLDVSGRRRDRYESAGITIFNNGLSGYSFDNRMGGISVLRSPDVCTHDPSVNNPNKPHKHKSQGVHEYRLGIRPHKGLFADSRAFHHAEAFNRPLYAVMDTVRDSGHLDNESSLIATDAHSVHLTGIKMADAQDGSMVFRCVETAGKHKQFTVTVAGHNKPIELSVAPHDVVTVRVHPRGPVEIIDIPELQVKDELL